MKLCPPAQLASSLPLPAQYNKSVDVFSFPLVLLELAVGDASYVSNQFQGKLGLGYVLGRRPEIPPSLREELPYLAKLVETCWSEDPSARFDFNTIVRILQKNSPT